MLIASASYSTPTFKDMTDHQREAFIANWPGLSAIMERRRVTYKDTPEKINDVSSWEYGSRQRLTLTEAAAIQAAGIRLELEAVDGTMLQQNKDNGPRLDKYGATHALDLTSGAVVQIAVPDLGLLQIGEVDWMEDACTEELQEKLDAGWRILAVCPPNAQRRPDYILGRAKRSEP